MTEFVDVVAISQGTPGPIAINAATYIGHKMAGFLGSVAATLGVVLPSFIIMMILGTLFIRFRKVAWVADILDGIRPVVVVLIAAAAFSVVPSSITGAVSAVLALVVVVATIVLNIDPVFLLAASGLLGVFLYR